MAGQDAVDQGDWSQFAVDPAGLQLQINKGYAEDFENARNPFARNNVGMRQGADVLSGGNPAVTHARMIQSRLSQIMQNVNAEGSDDEDPLDHQERLAHAVSIGMAGVNPQMAQAANMQAIRIAQAKDQQAKLYAETEKEKEDTSKLHTANEIAKATGGRMVLATPDNEILGQVNVLDADGNYRRESAQEIAALQDAAQKAGKQGVLMPESQYMNNRALQAQIRAQAMVQAADIAGQYRVEAAMARAAQGGAMSASNDRFNRRMYSESDMAATAIYNVARQNWNSSAGWTGLGHAPGPSLADSVFGNLRNKVADDDVQTYNTLMTGVGQNLRMLEMQGLGGSGGGGQGFSTQLQDRLTIRPTDTYGNILTKMAEMRQIVDKAMGAYMADPKMDPSIKQEVLANLEKMRQAVPYSVDDVTQFRKAQAKNHNLTLNQYLSAQQKSGTVEPGTVAAPKGAGMVFNTEAEAEAAAASGKLNKGDKITVGGKPATWQ